MILHSKKWLLLFTALVAILGVSGCNGQRELPTPTLVLVHGKLTIRGEPGRYVTITLDPQGGYGLPAEALTSHDGTFELRTLSNDGVPDGAAPGEYEVVLEGGGAPPDAPEGAVPTQIAGEFRTGIIVEVKAGDSEMEIDVP